MAEPKEFEGQNVTYAAGEKWRSLPAHKKDDQIISCWKLSPEELKTIAETGVIWFSVMGQQQPPIWLGAESPFKEAEKKDYNHKEAFCLMQYHCKKCGKIETLWNSRDGVTPFMISCNCGGEMQHILWKMDQCVPDHKPKTGDRIFTDMTEERAVEVGKKIYFLNKENASCSEEDFIKEYVSDMSEGEPMIITKM